MLIDRIGGYDQNPDPYFVDRDGDMNISDKALKAVAFIGVKKSGRFWPRATCFFVQQLEDQFWFRHLVTAEHVISGLLAKNHDLWLRVNTEAGGVAEIKLDPSFFYYHPEAETKPTDVAVCPIQSIDLPENVGNLDVTFMQMGGGEGSFLPSENFRKSHMGRGGQIAAIGLFRSHAGKNRNIPIVRAGHIAALPGEPVWTDHGYMEAYLIELQSIAGLSGSPVMAVPDLGFEIGKFVTGGRKDMVKGLALIGLIQGHFDIPNLNEDVVTDDSAQKNSVHTGIGVMIPVEKIVETLNQPDLIAMRKRIVDEMKKSGATSDVISDGDETIPPASDENPKHREDFMRLANAAARKQRQDG
jgi:hypothetical protein